MIHSFKAKNFYSIGDEIEVSLESRKISIQSPELYFDAPLNKKITKIEFIGGKNASGKTNILRILAFLRYFIIDSVVHSKNGTEIPFHAFVPTRNKPTRLEVTFSMEDTNIFCYAIELDVNKVIDEKLEKTYFKSQRRATTTVFHRQWSDDTNEYIVELSDDLPLIKQLTQVGSLLNTNRRASFISILSNFDDPENGVLNNITEYWNGVISNAMQFGSTESELSLTDFAMKILQEIYEDEGFRNELSSMLRKYDIGFSDIAKKEKMGPNQDQTMYGISHKYKNSQFSMSLHTESNGTKRIIILMRHILAALSMGGVAVIDEIDAFLHPDIFDDIVEMFMSTKLNKNNAQLIFSAHNYTILSRLDKQQITLSDKDENGQTEVWRLDEMKGMRPDDNFYTKYLTGAYGAKPKIGN